MTSKVLYRKWRPQRLTDVVGQESVTQTLQRAVATNRISHAYLLCGPRGTGKTSTARILAKAVNCTSPVDGEPDNTCDACVSISEGRALDLIEIDGASNRGIDDIRSLSDKINFAPNEFRYKVYIVDEVHMLTEQAFNALLKTLEEPPDHAIFILATTEAHKVPLTIISRCQRHDFRRVPLSAMSQKLAELCEAESVQATEEALEILARSATGSLRDAENLLEQAVVSYGSSLQGDQIREMLGLGGDAEALKLAEHVVAKSVGEGLATINEVSNSGADLRQLQRSVTEFLRAVMLVKSGSASELGYSDEVTTKIQEVASGSELSHLLKAIKAFSSADMRHDSSSPLPLELALVESSLAPEPVRQAAPAPQTQNNRPVQQQPARNAAPNSYQNNNSAPSRPPQQRQPDNRPSPRPPPRRDSSEPLPEDPAARLTVQWPQILRDLRNTGNRFKLGPVLRSAKGVSLDGSRIVAPFPHESHYDRFKGEMDNPGVRREVSAIINKAMGADYEIVGELSTENSGPTRKQANQSHLVRAAQLMGARIVDQREDEQS
ncbi:MAG: DNA polymerase III subunit gamma/tau [SAR202 cluster bacterium]|jgi:DNA polymerase-3 subunit gamma/tau|nr:DNA polymerase III subunit gamma/tau [SAR202 cluster bacterium]MDP6511985.1 DNA polymerase III subunit gamma/tau [SAR202 cluster bacterium]MDP6714232.1 DNA polymerase III subunit gamma/tau [SAR202 cluster bacterium]